MKRYIPPPTWLQRLRRKAQAEAFGPLPPAGVITPPDRRFDTSLCDKLKLPENNVFRHLRALKIPSVAYVAGAGPLLLDELKRIPDDAYVIACNRAIMAPWPFAIWMVFDQNCHRFPWYNNPPAGDYRKVFGYKLGASVPEALIFSSRHVDHPNLIAAGGLQGGGTIVGCALQLCFWAGCSAVVMLGAPMQGDTHFDGTMAQPRNCVWKQANRVAYHAQQMQARGMAIYSLSHNAMGIPILEGDLRAETPAP
jgi:hypothetical protein